MTMLAEPRAAVAATASKVPYLPGLDGMRAIAVIAVILYHVSDDPWMRGGFLGVEVFFVISGYLITLLLLNERTTTGTVDLKQFWIRRARRLLPALFTALFATATFLVLVVPEEVSRYRAELLAALTYSTNWYLILRDSSYFTELGRPSPLRHLWSLAVEEQFYLFWPIVIVLLFALVNYRRRALAYALGGLAVLSTLLMALLYRTGEDPSRVYFGTDTRLSGLVLGSMLACVWRPWRLAATFNKPFRRPIVDAVGIVALCGLALMHKGQNELSPGLYRGGFAVVGLLTLGVIAAATVPGGVLQTIFGSRWLVEIGKRSYGLYLWHWPVFVFTRPGIDMDANGPQVWVLRIGLTVILSELCYRFVEQPVRAGALSGWVRRQRLRRAEGQSLQIGLPLAASFAVVVLALGVVTRPERPNEIIQSLEAGGSVVQSLTGGATGTEEDERPVDTTVIVTQDPGTTVAPPVDPAVDPAATTVAPAQPEQPVQPDPAVAAATTVAPTPAEQQLPAIPRIVAIGDSVMLGAAGALSERFGGDIIVDAKVSRQFTEGTAILQTLKDQSRLPQVVVVHLGSNGTIGAASFEAMMQVLADVPVVVFVNVRNYRSWEGSVNATIGSAPSRYPNVQTVDWHGFSAGKTDWFYKDGIHLRPVGAAQFAELVAQAVG
jgi:peptidoglycan/LPS O-acetylase OafA/YrhL/lysophospholipase L1-like esterase